MILYLKNKAAEFTAATLQLILLTCGWSCETFAMNSLLN